MAIRPFQPTADCPIPPFERFSVTKLVPNCFLERPPEPLWESELFNFPVPMIPLHGFGCNCPAINATVAFLDECVCSSSSSNCDCLFWDEDAYWDFVANQGTYIPWKNSPVPPPATKAAYITAMSLGPCGYQDRIAGNWFQVYPLLGIPAEHWAAGHALAEDNPPLSSPWDAIGSWIVKPATVGGTSYPGRWGYYATMTPWDCANPEGVGYKSSAWWEAEASRKFNNYPVFEGRAVCSPTDPCNMQLNLQLWLPRDFQGPAGPKTAIVEVNEKGHKDYVGLHCVEAPEVWFIDQLNDVIVQMADRVVITMDKTFLKVCEPNTVRIASIVCSKPVAASGVVRKNKIEIQLSESVESAVLNITIMGIRKGMAGMRFPEFTREQKERNDAFWNQARG